MNKNFDLFEPLILNNPAIDSIIEQILRADSIAVIGHLEPDGDCIGAQLALGRSLKKLGKKVVLLNSGPFTHQSISQYEPYFEKEMVQGFDLYLAVDTPTVNRLGVKIKKTALKKTIFIDHHITNDRSGFINWVNVDFISCCEMVLLLLYQMKAGLNEPAVCQYLLNGILFDNGYFQHIRQDKYFSLLAGYYLVRQGADPAAAYRELFVNSNINREKLFARVVSRVEQLEQGKIVWTYMTEKDKEEFKSDFDSMKIFKTLMNIKKVKIYLFFKVDEENEKVNISFRSVDQINIAQIAMKMGGGGHKVAAGATVNGKFENIKNLILDQVKKLVQESES